MTNQNSVLISAVAQIASSALQTGNYNTIGEIEGAVQASLSSIECVGLLEDSGPTERAHEVCDQVESKIRFLCLNIAIALGCQLDRKGDEWIIVYEAIAPHILKAIDDAICAWNEHNYSQTKIHFLKV